MDPNTQPAFSLRSAKQIVQRSSKFTYLLSLLLPGKDRALFWAWYAYLRWVDDIADEGTAPQRERCEFIDRQIELVQDLYAGKPLILSAGEATLGALIAYDVGRGKLLKDPLSKMLAAMRYDIQRFGRLSDHAELHRNFDQEVSNYLFTIGYFCRIPRLPTNVPAAAAANGAKIAHILRDFLVDCDEGQFNISRQEIKVYGLSLPNIRSGILGSKGRQWVAVNVRMAERQLNSGLREAGHVRGVRYPLIVAILVAKYQSYLDQFRANHFLLTSQTTLHWAGFVANLLANIGSLLTARKEHTPKPVSAALGNLVPISKVQQAMLMVQLHPFCNKSIVTLLHNSLNGAGISAGDLRKLRRRFVTAYWLGRSSCTSIDPILSKDDGARTHVAGLVYAFWSLAVLELDSLVDDHAISQSAAYALVTEWLDRITAAIKGRDSTNTSGSFGGPMTSAADEIRKKFLLFTGAFQSYLIQYSIHALDDYQREAICEAFLTEARAFLISQIDSRDQKAIDPPHDWRWYVTQVLNQKTLGFALAPMTLWSRNDSSMERRRSLENAFLTLNSGYCHWQLLDDLADAKDDTNQGRITTPGFILLSQGAIACRYLDALNAGVEISDVTAQSLVDAMHHSELLYDRFVSSSLSDTYRHCIETTGDGALAAAGFLLRCALSNVDDDHLVPLQEISITRFNQANRYLLAMKSGDWNAASSVLTESRVAVRILLAVHEDAARIQVREQLSSTSDPSALKVLRIIEMLIKHCSRKAWRVTFQSG